MIRPHTPSGATASHAIEQIGLLRVELGVTEVTLVAQLRELVDLFSDLRRGGCRLT